MDISYFKTENGDAIRFGDINFTATHSKAFDAENQAVLFDSDRDGGDVSPLLSLCPIHWMYIDMNGVLCFELLTHWEGV